MINIGELFGSVPAGSVREQVQQDPQQQMLSGFSRFGSKRAQAPQPMQQQTPGVQTQVMPDVQRFDRSFFSRTPRSMWGR